MTALEAIHVIEVAIAEVEWEYPMNYAAAFELAIEALRKQNSGALPCRMGDTAFAIRRRAGGVRYITSGEISEIYYTSDMTLAVAIKNVGRGEWNKTFFGTHQEAEKAMKKMMVHG